MRYKYSEKEMRLIKGFNHRWGMGHINPVVLYRMLGREAFIFNRQDAYADSLRRCLVAIDKDEIHRGTKEFDDLIYGCEELDAPLKGKR